MASKKDGRNNRKLNCSICNFKRGWRNGAVIYYPITIVKKIGGSLGYLCKCDKCGHEYMTNSNAAKREYELKKQVR